MKKFKFSFSFFKCCPIFYFLFLYLYPCLCLGIVGAADQDISEEPPSRKMSIAISNGDINAVQKLIKEDVRNVNNPLDDNRTTPLHLAAYYGYTEIVQLLIDHEANVNIRSKILSTPLRTALERGHTEVAKILRENGAKRSFKIVDKCIWYFTITDI